MCNEALLVVISCSMTRTFKAHDMPVGLGPEEHHSTAQDTYWQRLMHSLLRERVCSEAPALQ